jgi:hypothetical protein
MMNPLFGEWYRKAGIQPTNETLTNRWNGIEAYTKKIDPAKVLELVRCFVRLPWKKETNKQEFIADFQARDAAFPVRDNALELEVLAGSTVIACIDQSPKYSDFASCVMDAAAARGLRQAPVVPEILAITEEHIFKRSAAIRQLAHRDKVIGAKHDDLMEAVKAAAAANQVTQLAPPLDAVLRALNETVNKVALSTEAALISLERNVRLYAEESNIVWWVFGGTSRDIAEPFAKINSKGFAAVLAGKELAELTESIPGPRASVAYLDKTLGATNEKKITLAEIAQELPQEWTARIRTNDELLDLCPILYTIHEVAQKRDPKGISETAHHQLGISESGLTSLEIAMQTYRESLVAKQLQQK